MTAPGTEAPETLPVRSEEDVVRVRQAVRALVVRLKFSLVDQTKIVTGTKLRQRLCSVVDGVASLVHWSDDVPLKSNHFRLIGSSGKQYSCFFEAFSYRCNEPREPATFDT